MNSSGRTIRSPENGDAAFCLEILPRVSRTFAINIGFLSGDLHRAVLCGYLFCRMIDTVEDSTALLPEEKVEILELWNSFFPFEGDWESRLGEFVSKSVSGRGALTENESETLLLKEALRVFRYFGGLSREVHARVSLWVREMSGGMAEFQRRASRSAGPVFCLDSLEELERYCYYVAGTVGRMLAELFVFFHPEIPGGARDTMQRNAVSFGLGLQMTNIIKDVRDDRGRNWCFIPKSVIRDAGVEPGAYLEERRFDQTGRVLERLIPHAASHLDRALAFTRALPKNARDLRMFCLLPLHFAAATLAKAGKWARKPGPDPIKISRFQVKATLGFCRAFYGSNALQNVFYRYYRGKLSK
jgi:farnesyl-diphosphate farnesyltransferase